MFKSIKTSDLIVRLPIGTEFNYLSKHSDFSKIAPQKIMMIVDLKTNIPIGYFVFSFTFTSFNTYRGENLTDVKLDVFLIDKTKKLNFLVEIINKVILYFKAEYSYSISCFVDKHDTEKCRFVENLGLKVKEEVPHQYLYKKLFYEAIYDSIREKPEIIKLREKGIELFELGDYKRAEFF